MLVSEGAGRAQVLVRAEHDTPVDGEEQPSDHQSVLDVGELVGGEPEWGHRHHQGTERQGVKYEPQKHHYDTRVFHLSLQSVVGVSKRNKLFITP